MSVLIENNQKTKVQVCTVQDLWKGLSILDLLTNMFQTRPDDRPDIWTSWLWASPDEMSPPEIPVDRSVPEQTF